MIERFTQKIPIVLLHGFMATSLMHFGYVIKHWYQKFPLVAIDLPGHGRFSEQAADHYFEHSKRYVLDKINKYQQVTLIGVSYLGGTLAHRIALEHPNKVANLILTGFSYDVPKTAFLAWVNSFRELADKNPALSNEYVKLHGEKWKETMACLVRDCNRSYEDSALTTLNMMKELKVRTAIINGDYKQNEVLAVNNIHRINQNLHGFLVEKAGHIVTHDQPKNFCQRVEAFWRGKDDITEEN